MVPKARCRRSPARPRRRSGARAAGRRWWEIPPRCRWPRTSVRVSLPVWYLDGARHLAADASEPVDRADAAPLEQLDRPVTGRAPSATTTMLKRRPAASRLRILSHTFSMSNGISGMQDDVGAAREPAVQG